MFIHCGSRRNSVFWDPTQRKTTVIKMLTGLLPLSGGEASVEGLNVRTDAERVRERIGYMSQNFSLYPDLTVTQNLTFYGASYGLDPQR